MAAAKLILATLFTLIRLNIFVCTNPVEIVDYATSMTFLNQFGYVSDNEMNMEAGESKNEKMESALMMYQEYNHLKPTGKLDEETRNMMEAPRCGNDDKAVVQQMTNSGKTKRYTTDSKWEKSLLTYKFSSYSRCCLSNEQIEKEFDLAIKMWMSAVGPSRLQIVKVEDDAVEIDIEIDFVNGSHHDNMSFAAMNTIAHAFYPQQAQNNPLRGDIHFNDEEDWVSGPDPNPKGKTFLETACHELGHALGLEHSMEFKAVMFASVKYKPDFQLHADDVMGIQSLYAGSEDSDVGLSDNDLETSASTHAQVVAVPGPSERLKNQPRILAFPHIFKPIRKQEPKIEITTTENVLPAVTNDSEEPEPRREESNYFMQEVDLETSCRNYLSKNLVHTNARSFSCLQFLWKEFYYHQAQGHLRFVKVN